MFEGRILWPNVTSNARNPENITKYILSFIISGWKCDQKFVLHPRGWRFSADINQVFLVISAEQLTVGVVELLLLRQLIVI